MRYNCRTMEDLQLLWIPGGLILTLAFLILAFAIF
jgi:hypothetical protein